MNKNKTILSSIRWICTACPWLDRFLSRSTANENHDCNHQYVVYTAGTRRKDMLDYVGESNLHRLVGYELGAARRAWRLDKSQEKDLPQDNPQSPVEAEDIPEELDYNASYHPTD